MDGKRINNNRLATIFRHIAWSFMLMASIFIATSGFTFHIHCYHLSYFVGCAEHRLNLETFPYRKFPFSEIKRKSFRWKSEAISIWLFLLERKDANGNKGQVHLHPKKLYWKPLVLRVLLPTRKIISPSTWAVYIMNVPSQHLSKQNN